jgi:hypothetical protein
MMNYYPTKAPGRAAAPNSDNDASTPGPDSTGEREAAVNRAVSEVHNEAMRTTAGRMVEELRGALTASMLAYITGQSLRTIQRWSKGGAEEIRQNAPGVAQTWFLGADPQLDFDTPAKAIREDRLEEALAAARSFVASG